MPWEHEVVRGALGLSWDKYLLACAKRVVRYPYEKLVLQRALAADINTLLDRTTIVSERRARYGIDRAALPRAACFIPVSAASISASSLHRADNPDQFVGIMEQADALANKIKASVHDDSLKVLSIVGFGGLGKTTLAMELCRQLDADFPCQAQVSVSQAFNIEKDMKALLGRVLQQLSKKKADDKQIIQMNLEEPSSKIKELLKQTRYLIVIDDVWSLPACEAICNIFPKNNCGSRIIVTTRIKEVAKAASVSKYLVHHMEPLEKEASEKLFVRRVFGSAKMGDCPSQLKETMDTILKKCGGFPLAIISIASLLPSSGSAESVDMWKRVSRSIGSHMESHPTLEGMRQLITLSYDYLPHHLKACMIYLSIFPEDYFIGKVRLLYRWIAEGLVTEKRGLTLLEVAEEYLNELISRNMIQLDNIMSVLCDDGREEEVEGCRVHDMILEVMVSKSQESNFVSLVGRQLEGLPRGHGKVRRLSIHDNDHEEEQHSRHGIEAMRLQHVRSLTTFNRDGLETLLGRLGEFKLLRVLDLEDCMSVRNKHMRDVCRLYLLKFLSLRGTCVRRMPHKVGNLQHLETLDVRDLREFRLPLTVTKLSKLERLWSNWWNLPRGLGKMVALREVYLGILDSPSVAQEIGKLTQLQLLRIDIYANIGVGCLANLASSLSKTSNLRMLSLNFRAGGSCLEFLPGVSVPPPLLQCLGMFGPKISQLPDWISSLTHLSKIEVGDTEELDGDKLFDVLWKVPNLRNIQLTKIECKDRGVLVARPEHSFSVLRILKVVECPTTLTFEKGSMTKLEMLVLEFGYTKEMSILGVENLENLKEVKLSGRKGNPSMQLLAEQLKTHSKSKQIKIVVDCRG